MALSHVNCVIGQSNCAVYTVVNSALAAGSTLNSESRQVGYCVQTGVAPCGTFVLVQLSQKDGEKLFAAGCVAVAR